MDKKMNNEELQSRREFFKKAAKSALPILTAVALVNIPAVSQAVSACAPNCKGGCYQGCHHDCKGTCYAGCTHKTTK